MKHLIFIAWWWPYPANNGAKIRIYNLLKHLSKGYDVTLLAFAEGDEATPEQIEHMRGFCQRVEVVPRPTYHPGAVKALLGYFSPWPRSLVDVYSPAMEALLQQIAGQTEVNAIITSEMQTIRYLDVLPDTPAVLEEAEITIFHNHVTGASGRAGRFRAQLTLTKLENAFKRLLMRGVAMTVVSEAERDYMRRFAPPDARVEVVPNGVDTVANRPQPTIQPKPHSLIYTGAVTYNANWDAVSYFARDVLPLIRQRVPDAQFTITGGTGNIDVSQLAALPGVHFSGYLPTVAAAVQESWALVTPLRIGGGTRLKILEAMALGTPVISTAKGAEGIAVHPGEDILIADTPQEIADAVCRLFDDAALRVKLAAGGRALVEREYDWGVIGERLSGLIEDVIALGAKK